MTWVQPGATPDVILLNFGDFMLQEPTFPQQHEVQPQTFLRANFRHTYDRGNVGFESTFSHVQEFANNAALRDFMMDHSIVMAFHPSILKPILITSKQLDCRWCIGCLGGSF